MATHILEPIQINKPTGFFGGLVMAGMPRLFKFKRERGHLTDRTYPPGAKIEENDEIACPQCSKMKRPAPAYVVFVCPVWEKQK